MKLHPHPILLLIYFALNLAYVESNFLSLKKKFTLSVFSVCSLKDSPNFGTIRNNNVVEKQPGSSQGGFCCIFRAIRN